jgi:hypothetical protein
MKMVNGAGLRAKRVMAGEARPATNAAPRIGEYSLPFRQF